MKFCWSTLMVRDMTQSLQFYQTIIGLRVDRRFHAGPGTEIAFLGDGETKIELICREGAGDIDVGADISWGFEVDSLEDTLALVKEKGVPVHSGPFSPNPHTRFFYVLDPNGLKIQFVERR